MTSKELIKLMQADGWQVDRIKGSHYVMKKDGQTEIIPFHNADLKPGILNTILKRTGLK